MSMEKKYTQEEIKAIVDEEIRKQAANRELSPDDLENVSGGISKEQFEADAAVARHLHQKYGYDFARTYLEQQGWEVKTQDYPNPEGGESAKDVRVIDAYINRVRNNPANFTKP